jgi:hypothetical protein
MPLSTPSRVSCRYAFDPANRHYFDAQSGARVEL